MLRRRGKGFQGTRGLRLGPSSRGRALPELSSFIACAAMAIIQQSYGLWDENEDLEKWRSGPSEFVLFFPRWNEAVLCIFWQSRLSLNARSDSSRARLTVQLISSFIAHLILIYVLSWPIYHSSKAHSNLTHSGPIHIGWFT